MGVSPNLQGQKCLSVYINSASLYSMHPIIQYKITLAIHTNCHIDPDNLRTERDEKLITVHSYGVKAHPSNTSRATFLFIMA